MALDLQAFPLPPIVETYVSAVTKNTNNTNNTIYIPVKHPANIPTSPSMQAIVIDAETNISIVTSGIPVDGETVISATPSNGIVALTSGFDTLSQNKFYKIHLRYAKLQGGIHSYSEWSSPSYVKCIGIPNVSITNLNYPLFTVKFSFPSGNTETFKSYKITIKKGTPLSSSSIVYEGGWETLNGASSINVDKEILPVLSQVDTYWVTVDYQTQNGYSNSISEDFALPSLSTNKSLTMNIKNFANEITLTTGFTANTAIQIRKRKAEEREWSMVKNKNLSTSKVEYDTLIEDGIQYIYEIVQSGSRQEFTYVPKFAGTLLIDKDNIFYIEYNAKVSGFKYNLTEVVTPTLGAQFPFVRKSGNTKYRTFNIEGIISWLGIKNDTYNISDSISATARNNFTYVIDLPEDNYQKYLTKENKNKVIEFLLNGKPKLFKSSGEGLAIVSLTGVGFSPNEQLGREVYSFSAVATEIAKCTYENCIKYNLMEE